MSSQQEEVVAIATASHLVNATHLLDQARATIDDATHVAAQHHTWREDRPLLVIDNGQIHADPADLTWVKTFLANAARQRRENRIDAADRDLTAAHEALLAKNRNRRTAGWASEMLAAFARVSTALRELIDAREDAGEINPDRAARLRASVDAHLRETQAIGASAMRKTIRMARSY